MVKVVDQWKAKRAKKPFARKWPFALGLGFLLGVLALIDKGHLTTDAGLNSPCRVEVTAETMLTREEPEPNARSSGKLKRGDLRGATTTVRNGYRQLSDQSWALDQYLRPLPPTDKCKPV